MKRTPLRRIGRVAQRYEALRQTFLKTLLDGQYMASLPSGTRIGLEGYRVHDPRFADTVSVCVYDDPLAPAHRRYTTWGTGEVHHDTGRTGGRREDLTNLVLVSPGLHRKITAYEKNTGKRWDGLGE